MLNATIEIWPFGEISQARTIAHVAMWNDGTGSYESGNYGYVITVETDERFFDEDATLPTAVELRDMARSESFDDDRIRAQGRILGHRRAAGSTSLLAKVLRDAGLDHEDGQ